MFDKHNLFEQHFTNLHPAAKLTYSALVLFWVTKHFWTPLYNHSTKCVSSTTNTFWVILISGVITINFRDDSELLPIHSCYVINIYRTFRLRSSNQVQDRQSGCTAHEIHLLLQATTLWHSTWFSQKSLLCSIFFLIPALSWWFFCLNVDRLSCVDGTW